MLLFISSNYNYYTPEYADKNHVELKDVQKINFEEIERTMKRCIERGVIIDWFLYNTDCLRIAPPLIITKKQIREVCAIILEALDADAS